MLLSLRSRSILERATTDEIQEAALRKGMATMRRDGWLKCCMGLTTLSEVARQTPRETEATPPKTHPGEVEAKAKQEEFEKTQHEALPAPPPNPNALTGTGEDAAPVDRSA